MATKMYNEYGCEFEGPFGVGTFLGEGIVSYPNEALAHAAARAACTQENYTTTVYGPQPGTRRARKIATYYWNE